MINDHRYDAGWPRDDSKGCIVWVSGTPAHVGTMTLTPTEVCTKPEAEHRLSEYPSQRPSRYETTAPEPKPYRGELDWPALGLDSEMQ